MNLDLIPWTPGVAISIIEAAKAAASVKATATLSRYYTYVKQTPGYSLLNAYSSCIDLLTKLVS